MAVKALREAILSALESLPGKRVFHVHVLVSAPKKHADLFPFAQPRPRTYAQQVLVLLSEQATPDSPRLFVTAIELTVYTLPSTSTGIIYVSKVDSTGQGAFPFPTTTAVRAVLLHYARPSTRPIAVDHLWIQLFARAQNQYLFPNSADFPGKKPLTDIKLCSWWKKVYTELSKELAASGETKIRYKSLFYILPGMNELEACQSLKTPLGADGWVYGHPYSHTDVPLPCPPSQGTDYNLGQFIPSFDDDPKSRFIDDLAYDTKGEGVKTPQPKKARTRTSDSSKGTSTLSLPQIEESQEATKKTENKKPPKELTKVTADEFWERMSFRQECVQGAVTGFFTLIVSSPHAKDVQQPQPSPLEPQPGQVSAQLIKRVLSSLMTGVEFSTVERAAKATETIEKAIKGLCDGVSPVPSLAVSTPKPPSLLQPVNDGGRRTPPPTNGGLAPPPSTPPPRAAQPLPEVSPNPFPEPVASLDTYNCHIYGSVIVKNPSVSRSSEPSTSTTTGSSAASVTVLTVRRKKKRPAE